MGNTIAGQEAAGYFGFSELMLLNCGVGEDSRESLGLQGDPTSQSYRKSVLNIHWKDWCWSWSSNTLATWCKELTLLKRHWWWERLRAGGEGDDRGWDGWMASPTQWTKDRGVWPVAVHGVAKSQTGLSDWATRRPADWKDKRYWSCSQDALRMPSVYCWKQNVNRSLFVK